MRTLGSTLSPGVEACENAQPMPPTQVAPQCVVDLRPRQYQASVTALRSLLDGSSPKVPFLRIGVRTPTDDLIELQLRQENAYVVAFKGADGWYGFNGETDAWGPSCGTGSNYNDLGTVGPVSYDDLKRLGELARFRKGAGALDKRLIAILIAVTSEAVRFATVATYFCGLVNSVGTDHSPYLRRAVDFEYLKRSYFTQWEKPPEPLTQPGTISHFGRGEILLPRHR
jgi:hypothetical protein